MELTDIQSLHAWEDLERAIHAKSGLDTNVFNTKGYRITAYKQWANNLCPAIKESDKGQSFICAVAHMNIAGEAERTKRPVIEECDGGLVKLVVPIFVDDQFIGTVGACGLLMDAGEVDTFMITKTIDMAEDKIEELADNLGHITETELNELTLYIQDEINRIMVPFSTKAFQAED